MDLDAWINEPEPDSEDESSDSSESLFPTVKYVTSNTQSTDVITNGGSFKQLKSKKETKKSEAEIQLEIEKVIKVF